MAEDLRPAGREPYGTGIRNAIARRDFDELRAYIGVIEMSVQELARHDASKLGKVAGVHLTAEKCVEIDTLLKRLETLLKPARK